MSNVINGPLYTVPTAFARRFDAEFPNYRIRWSFRKHCWFIEQQCGRGALPPVRIDPEDDQMIRARDGYWLVMEIQPGDRMGCPGCHSELKVPTREFKEIRCNYCMSKGRDGRTVAGYFPFGEPLLDHLRCTDPLRGGTQRMADAADAANQRLLASARRATSNQIEAGTKADFNKLFGIQSVGYTGANRNIHLSKDIN